MYIMGRYYNQRAVNTIIAALLLIAITVAAAILLYVFSIGLLGSLGSSGGSQTKQQLILEAYDATPGTTVILHLRNVGSAGIAVGTADVFINGVGPAPLGGTCVGTLLVQAKCDSGALTIPSPLGGVAYVVKVVTPDGAVFSYTIIDGQAS